MSRLTLTALAVALTAAFLCGACRAGDGGTLDLPLLPPPAKEKSLWEKACQVAQSLWKEPGKIAGRLKGRVLGSFIEKGMTKDQVKGLLGKDDRGFGGSCLVGGFISEWLYYRGPGIMVTYDNADPCTRTPTDTLRVAKTTYEPLLGWPWTTP